MGDIEAFAHLTGDENPLHLDEEFARPRLFGGRVAHGLFTLAITLGQWYRAGAFDGLIVVFSGIDKLRFLRPVRPEDSLRSQVTVVRHEASPRGDLVDLENTTFNQRDEAVLSFSARLLLARGDVSPSPGGSRSSSPSSHPATASPPASSSRPGSPTLPSSAGTTVTSPTDTPAPRAQRWRTRVPGAGP